MSLLFHDAQQVLLRLLFWLPAHGHGQMASAVGAYEARWRCAFYWLPALQDTSLKSTSKHPTHGGFRRDMLSATSNDYTSGSSSTRSSVVARVSRGLSGTMSFGQATLC